MSLNNLLNLSVIFDLTLFSRQDLNDLFTLKPEVESLEDGGEGVTETGEMPTRRVVVDLPKQQHQQDAEEENLKEGGESIKDGRDP